MAAEQEQLPAYGFTPYATFKINSTRVPSLVDPLDVKRHLSLLGAFHNLRRTVENGCEGFAAHLGSEARWSVFCTIAVRRFELYLETAAPGKSELPPLDCLLVWHAYLLNTRWYRDDCERNISQRRALREFPLAAIDLSHPDPPSGTGQIMGGSHGYAFRPAGILSTCLRLRPQLTNERIFTPWLSETGTGYAQQNFEVSNSQGFRITHEVLGVARLARDIRLCLGDDNGPYLAGTCFTGVGTALSALPQVVCARATKIRNLLFVGPHGFDISPPRFEETMGWSLAGAREKLSKQFKRGGRTVQSILSAYTRGENFSLDLTTAVLRQGTFVQKMHDLGWTNPDRFDVDHSILIRSIARYHAFLDLVASSPSTFFVPTLDIDLCWHTHQLFSSKYRTDCFKVVGRFLDHNDKVEEGTLSTGFDVTARAWEARFGVPYSTCGCPLPDKKTLSKISSKLGFSSKPPNYSPTTLATTPNTDDSDATHPSEHNSIVLVGNPAAERARVKRAKEFEARKKRDELKASSKGGEKRRETSGHETAFLYPVPLYPYYGAWGYPGAAGCAVVAGSVMSGTSTGTSGGGGGCLIGAGACGGGDSGGPGGTSLLLRFSYQR